MRPTTSRRQERNAALPRELAEVLAVARDLALDDHAVPGMNTVDHIAERERRQNAAAADDVRTIWAFE